MSLHLTTARPSHLVVRKWKLLVPCLLLAILLSSVLVVRQAFAEGTQPEQRFQATLTGANEIAGGDPDGSGIAHLRLSPEHGQVCFEIDVANLATIVAAHIHAGPAGVNGPVVVNFNPVVNGLHNCVSGVSRDLINKIIAAPQSYYVNVHTTEFPGGAIRGQLGGS
jgi:hypothetical protein